MSPISHATVNEMIHQRHMSDPFGLAGGNAAPPHSLSIARVYPPSG